jgi:hypothetical protein
MQNLCNSCKGILKPLKARIRERVGCPANCSGILVEKIVSMKCSKCSKIFPV